MAQDDVRGASGLVGGARWVGGMLPGPDLPDGGRLVTFDVLKTNYGGWIGGPHGFVAVTDGQGIRAATDGQIASGKAVFEARKSEPDPEPKKVRRGA